MSAAHDPYVLPEGLPVPKDDGAADHLPGLELPSLVLESSQGRSTSARLRGALRLPAVGPAGRAAARRLGRDPGRARLHAAVVRVPRPRGRAAALGRAGGGLSAQTLDDQREFAERNRMPFPVIADPERRLGAALGLPTFEIEG